MSLVGGFRHHQVLWTALAGAALFSASIAVWPAHGNQILQWFYDFPSRTGVFRGHYSTGFEESAFQPCGSKQRWWVEVDDRAEPGWSRAIAAHNRRSYVEWRGTRTGKGRYG